MAPHDDSTTTATPKYNASEREAISVFEDLMASFGSTASILLFFCFITTYAIYYHHHDAAIEIIIVSYIGATFVSGAVATSLVFWLKRFCRFLASRVKH